MKERLLVTVKTYPTLSSKYAELSARLAYGKTVRGCGSILCPFVGCKTMSVFRNISGSLSG